MDLLLKYFPDLSAHQQTQFEQLLPVYREWNEKINVVSRKDIDNLYERHVLHSLTIAKFVQFLPGTKVMDLGTGGGFPGIPLAIFFPEVQFHLVDSIGKKITVVQEVVKATGLENVTSEQQRAELVKDRFDFVVTRAVADLAKLNQWARQQYRPDWFNVIPNGLIALKGGPKVKQETAPFTNRKVELYPINSWFEEPFFDEKFVVYLPNK